MTHPAPRTRRFLALALLALLAGLGALPAPWAGAEDDPPTGGPPPVDPPADAPPADAPPAAHPPAGPADAPSDPGEVRGRQYFEQAIAFVNDGKPGIHQVHDFYVDLADVQVRTEGNNHSGFLRLWFQAPDRYRFEARPLRPLRDLTVKILSGDQMWIVNPRLEVTRMHGRPGGDAAIRQLQEDRKRLFDLARFLTLEGLKGPGVVLRYEGIATGRGTFAGERLKVTRRIPGGGDIVFYLAFERTADGRGIARALQPEIVKIEGDAARNEPTEYYLLYDWALGPQFRFPRRVEALRQANPRAAPVRFLLAFPEDIRINTGLGAEVFQPPTPAAPR